VSNLNYSGEAVPPTNILAARYASPEMVTLFSSQAQVFMERGLWIEVMRGQKDLGLPIPQEAISDYETVQDTIDLDSIRRREEVTHHDVKARVEEFDDLAGHQFAHMGMTSRDATENVEQMQVLNGFDIISDRTVSTLARFGLRALEFTELPMAGRSHNVAAQTITLGKRFSNFGEELLDGYDRLRTLRGKYQVRGIKGPMGTQQDMLDLFEGDESKVAELESRVAEALGFSGTLNSVGQIYPRSMDFDTVTALRQLVSGPSSFATTLRSMAGYELATEGFKPGQVGSSAMPHKMNAAKSERINSLKAVLSGHVVMASELAGNQWNEGDVSCSADRRVFIPDSFFATDGVLQTTMAVLDGFGAYPVVIEKELERYLPFLITTKALMAAVKAGVGREDAHEAIKEHATKVALEMREEGLAQNDLIDRLASDPRINIPKDTLGNAMTNPLELTGMARGQVATFVDNVQEIVMKKPELAEYKPTVV
jgi:adenylosuccinate lyase